MTGNGSNWPNTWAPPPAIEYRMPAETSTDVVMVKAPMPRAGGGRFIAVKPKVSPRGGDDKFRAAAKAARKARRNQRKRK